MNNIEEIFLTAINEMYDAEIEISKDLAKLITQSTTEELKEALEKHSEETFNHISRLEEISSILETKLKVGKQKGVRGLLKDIETDLEKSSLELIDSAITY